MAIYIYPILSVAQSDYYYYKGEQINLTIEKEKINIFTYSDFLPSSISDLNFEAFE